MPIRTILSRAIKDGTIETADIKSTGLGSAAIEDQAITPAKISRSGGSAGLVLKINDANTGIEFGEVTGVSTVILDTAADAGDNLLLDGTDGSSSNAGSKVLHNDVLDATAIGGAGGGEDIALGVGQTWTEETSNRVKNVEYTNTTGRPIAVIASHNIQAVAYCTVKIDGVTIANNYVRFSSASCGPCITIVVPAGSTYEYYMYGSVAEWWELK